MDSLFELFPIIPQWVAIPLLVFSLILGLWPKIREAARDLSAKNRAYESEKKRLDLLKLKLEIEAIAKEHSLDLDIAELRHDDIWEVPSVADLPVLPKTPLWKLTISGAFGAVIPTIVRMSIFYSTSPSLDFFVALSFFVGLFVFAIVGAILVVTLRPTSLKAALFQGIAVAALISIILGAVETSPQLPTS